MSYAACDTSKLNFCSFAKEIPVYRRYRVYSLQSDTRKRRCICSNVHVHVYFCPFLACGITYTAGTFPTTVSSSDPQFSPYSNNIDCTLNFDQSASDVTLLEFLPGFAVEAHPTCIWDALEV